MKSSTSFVPLSAERDTEPCVPEQKYVPVCASVVCVKYRDWLGVCVWWVCVFSLEHAELPYWLILNTQ